MVVKKVKSYVIKISLRQTSFDLETEAEMSDSF